MRGTQSFVGVMTAVWRRPSLAGLEIAWRWAGGVAVLAAGSADLAVRRGVLASTADGASVRCGGCVSAGRGDHTLLLAYANAVAFLTGRVWRWLVAVRWLCFGWWCAAVGRTAVLRRLDGGLQARRISMLVLGALRAGLLAVVLGDLDLGRWGGGAGESYGAGGARARSRALCCSARC